MSRLIEKNSSTGQTAIQQMVFTKWKKCIKVKFEFLAIHSG